MKGTIKKETDADFYDIMKTYDPSKNFTKPFMTIYEKTAILGLRMEQLSNGSPSYLDEQTQRSLGSVRKIAEAELSERKVPFMVSRRLPNGKLEYWRLDDMIIV
jgi:DNA-directed RNA polymerase subunit K/omega